MSNNALNDPLDGLVQAPSFYMWEMGHPRSWHTVPVSPFQYNMGDDTVDVNALTTVLQNGGDIN